MDTLPYDTLHVILDQLPNTCLLNARRVNRLWDEIIHDVMRSSVILSSFCVLNHLKRSNVLSVWARYNGLWMRHWYDCYPGPNPFFTSPHATGSFDFDLHVTDVSGAAEEDMRCCAFTRSGSRCSKRATCATRMCKVHHSKLPFMNSSNPFFPDSDWI